MMLGIAATSVKCYSFRSKLFVIDGVIAKVKCSEVLTKQSMLLEDTPLQLFTN